MMSHSAELLISLFILNLGTAFGAGLYETRIILPLWFYKLAGGGYGVNREAMRNIDTGRKFWAFVTTVPLTLLTLANLGMAWQSQQPGQAWWFGAALITLVERIGTFAFFIPTAIRLQQADRLSASSVTRLATWWIRLNYGRNLLTLAAWIAALSALLTF